MRGQPGGIVVQDLLLADLDQHRRQALQAGGQHLGVAAAFGGRSVATADFATRDPEMPITIAAREGEPLVLAAGDRRFVLPDGL